MQVRAKALKAARRASALNVAEARGQGSRAPRVGRASDPPTGGRCLALPYLLRASSPAARETIAPRAPLRGNTRTTASEDRCLGETPGRLGVPVSGRPKPPPRPYPAHPEAADPASSGASAARPSGAA